MDFKKNWNTFDSWYYRYPNNHNNFYEEMGTKIFISVDPSDIYEAKKIFRDFMNKYDLYGKMPLILDDGIASERNALIIYSTLTKDKLLELETELQNKGIKPRLLKSGSRIPDIAIKGSLYFYFKCDKLKKYAYNNKKQVKLMDKIRISNKFDDVKIIKYYKEMDLSDEITIEKSFKDYDENDGYFQYLNIIKNCNAVQRQILDAIFRNELRMSDGVVGWYNFDIEFIKDELELIKNVIKNTDGIPESELRKFLNYFVIGGYVDKEPIMTKEGYNFVQNIKSYLSTGKVKDIENEFENLYSKLSINKQFPIMKAKKDFLTEMKEYYKNADFFDLGFGNFALSHLTFIIDDFCNYYEENGLDIKEDLKEIRKLLDIKKIKDKEKYLLGDKNNNYYKNIIIPNLDIILSVIEKYKNIIAIRTAANEYNLFIKKYSLKLKGILTEQLKKIISDCLYKIFSYDNTIKEKIEAKKTLQNNLYNIKKYFNYINNIGEVNKYKPFEDAKSFLMWNGILKSGTDDEFLENIDKFRRRYIKYNNLKYNDFEDGNLITSNLENNMIFARGMEISDKLADKFLNIGMDGEYIDYITTSDCNIVRNNTLHKGLISVTTDLDVADKYAGNSDNSKIFLISAPAGIKVLNSIFSDNRACDYSELDLVSIPAEWIIGYFKVKSNGVEQKEYLFKKNPNFKNENLSKKFSIINNFNTPFVLKDGLKCYDYDIKFILLESDFERKKLQEKCGTEMINMIYDITNYSGPTKKNNILLQKTIDLFEDDCIKRNIYKILGNICINYMPNQINDGFNPAYTIIVNNKIHHIAAHVYNNYQKLKIEEEIELEKNKKIDKNKKGNCIDFYEKNEIVTNIIKLYNNINLLLKEKYQVYSIISAILMDISLKILMDKNYKIKKPFDDENGINHLDNIYEEDVEYKKFIIKNSVDLLKIIENELNDLENPQAEKRNNEEQSEKLKNIINNNFKNYNFKKYTFMNPNEKEKIFLNITDAINYYKEEEEEEEINSFEINI